MKTAVIVLSDPKSGSEESLGRVFNALSTAHEARAAGDETIIVFSGTGTRWPAELEKLGHPGRELYDSVRDLVKGSSCGCAAVFGSTEDNEACGVPLLKNYDLPGTDGVASLRRLAAEGWTTFAF